MILLSRWAKAPTLIAVLIAFGGVFLTCVSVAWGIFIIGGGILGLMIIYIITLHNFIKRASYVDGIVVAHQIDKSSEGSLWLPIVRYALPDGREITFQSHTSHLFIRKSLPVSKKVPVLYDPSNPESAIIDGPLEHFGVYIFLLFPIALLVFAILMLVGLIPKSSFVEFLFTI